MPRHERAAIRRFHIMINHKPGAMKVQGMRWARVSHEVMKGVKHFRCYACAEISMSTGISQIKVVERAYWEAFLASCECSVEVHRHA